VPRAGLTPSIVAAEAARIADEVGWERLTLAAIAHRLGVAVPSLYKHVPEGLAGVRRGVTLIALRELGTALAASQDGLAPLGAAYRAYAKAHPGRYAATLRAVDPADQEAAGASHEVLATVLGVLNGYGLDGDEAIDAARTLRSSLHGFVALEAVGGFGLPRDVDRSFEQMMQMLEAGIARMGSARRRH
jgi:AcrR family transcriptional regulator